LSRDGLISYPKPAYLEGRRVPAVDASEVVEKGRIGETYRLHYAIDLHTMTSDTFKITKEETGETLSNFNFRRGDLVVADRAYGTLKGINHCLNRGADYIESVYKVLKKLGFSFGFSRTTYTKQHQS
jgi:hypothetical protein